MQGKSRALGLVGLLVGWIVAGCAPPPDPPPPTASPPTPVAIAPATPVKADAPATPVEADGCTFAAPFQALRDHLAETVGDCVELEQVNPTNGNREQRTSAGLLVWRPTDGVAAFTDGAFTWYNCPDGVEQIPAQEPFQCEGGQAPYLCPDAIRPSTASSQVGRQVTVYGRVVRAIAISRTAGEPTLLEVTSAGGGRLLVVIAEKDRPSFLLPPEQLYVGKRVCVSGLVETYNGRPSITASQPTSILVTP